MFSRGSWGGLVRIEVRGSRLAKAITTLGPNNWHQKYTIHPQGSVCWTPTCQWWSRSHQGTPLCWSTITWHPSWVQGSWYPTDQSISMLIKLMMIQIWCDRLGRARIASFPRGGWCNSWPRWWSIGSPRWWGSQGTHWQWRWSILCLNQVPIHQCPPTYPPCYHKSWPSNRDTYTQ